MSHSTPTPSAAAQERPTLNERTRRSIFFDVMRATMSLEFALRLQQGIFNNFAVEVLRIQPYQLGLVQGIREIPGLLTAPLAMAAGYFRENVWAGLCILIAAAGLFTYSITTTFFMLVVATLILSVGFHLFYPVQSSIIMKSQLPAERATKIGLLNSGASAASLASFFIVIAVTRFAAKPNYSALHAMAGVFAVLGGLMVIFRKIDSSGVSRRKMDFNPRYMSYYTLTFLGGARRHITMTFAGFLLVQVHKTPVSTMVMLSALSSLVSIFTRPIIGRLIDKWGEQKSLMVNYSLVVPIFMAYAFVQLPVLLFIAYILDNGSVGFDVAITTHLGKLAPPEALSNAYAMGSTINHISGVSVPMIGGWLWDAVGAPWVFVMGTILAGTSLLYSRNLDSVERRISVSG